MKLKAVSGVYYRDAKKDDGVPVQAGEEFELHEVKDALQIYELLGSGKVTVSDEKAVPATAQYLVSKSFTRKIDGIKYTGDAGLCVELPQQVAVKLMISRHVKPLDTRSWDPLKHVRFPAVSLK